MGRRMLTATVATIWTLALLGSPAAVPTAHSAEPATRQKPAAKADANAKPDTVEKKSADVKPVDESTFLRILRDPAGTPTAMQTAVAHYVATEGKFAGATVDLIGAVHVGERTYYHKLNELFTKYESLLYELVAPKGTRIPKGGVARSGHPVGVMQHGLSDVLGLVHQMNEVDYTKKNFVHADMTPDEFAASMEKRGESWLTMAFQAMGQGIAAQSQPSSSRPELEMLAALFDKNPEVGLKRAMAKQFEDLDASMDVFGGKEGSTIITERNKKALEVLRKQLGKGKKNVGIFYGAGHLPDMHERLLSEFGLQLTGIEWLTAWDMTDAAKKAAAAVPAEEKKPAEAPKRSKRKRQPATK
jgi:hypothetical protein